MKKYILILGILLSTQQLFAQITEKQLRKLEREEAKKEQREKRGKLTTDLVEKRHFVLKAHYLGNNRGTRYTVNPTINFVKVEEDQAVIQIGNDIGLGYNGVGGITATGKITSWEVKERKNNGYFLNFSVTTSIGHYSIKMDVSGNGGARATLSGLRGGNLVYEGDLVPVEASRVFKGNSM